MEQTAPGQVMHMSRLHACPADNPLVVRTHSQGLARGTDEFAGNLDLVFVFVGARAGFLAGDGSQGKEVHDRHDLVEQVDFGDRGAAIDNLPFGITQRRSDVVLLLEPCRQVLSNITCTTFSYISKVKASLV